MKSTAIVCLLIFLCGSAFAEVQTITGEVMDSFCYVTKDARGKEHAQCASSCIKAGIPVGVLTDNGEFYFPLRADHKPANPLFEKYGGLKVKVSGTVYEKHNTKFIVVSSVEEAK